MKELAKKYKSSLNMLSERVNELKSQKEVLALKPYSPVNEDEIYEINARLKLLIPMESDLKLVAKEVEHYYDRAWWRHEGFTLNQRKSRQFIYVEPVYDESLDELGENPEDEDNVDDSNGCVIDRSTEASSTNVLFRWKESHRDSQRTKHNKAVGT